MTEEQQVQQASEDIKRAELARQVLNNPIFQESFSLFREACMTRFAKTKFEESKEREEIWRKLQTLDFVENNLRSLIETGEFARETISFLERAKKTVGL